MKNAAKLALWFVLLSGVAATGYWFGTRAKPPAKEATNAGTERKILYYRNPMGLADISPVPKKDSMGMDYVPVYTDEAATGPSSVIAIDIAKVQKLGVQSEAATLRTLDRDLRITGRIEADERRVYTIAPKFEGWVDRLYVNATGQTVAKGQPLFAVYSPELVSAQREHALAMQGLASLQDADEDARKSMQQLAAASAARLKNWDIAGAPAGAGETANEMEVTFRSPVNGIVLEKKAVQGMRFMPGDMLYQIADLSSVWVIAEVPEQDIAAVQPGSQVQISVDAYPGRTFPGRVNFVYPTMDASTRTVQVRIEMSNPKGLLKPAMFANALIRESGRDKVLAVPASAVIDSGTRQVVLVRLAEGRFEPRTVTLGARTDAYAEVLSGVAEGEQVVTSATFLIDAESNLKAALGAFGEHAAAETHAAPATPAPQEPAKTVGHVAQGILEAINEDGSLSIKHGPIASLGWPGMTMDFPLANSSLAAGIKPGTQITFEIVERAPGEWVITRLQADPQHQHGER